MPSAPAESRRMGQTGIKDRATEIRRLFEELRQAYQRATEAANAGAPPAGGQSAFIAESHKATDIIAKIRAVDGL